MELNIGSRLKHAWNAFLNRDPPAGSYGGGYSVRPDRVRLTRGNERTFVTSVYNRIAMDCATITIQHCKLDENGRYDETVDSPLNSCLNLAANLDQTGRSFMQDVVISMLDEGCVAIVPTVTDYDPTVTDSYKIYEMRVGKIVEWYPEHVRVKVYNNLTGQQEEITLPKKAVAIIENPFYTIMNEPNSTMQRLVRKLSLMDIVDEQVGANKLDIIIQLPYAVKTDMRREQANKRRKEIEEQLQGSKYGIAWTDGTERITQLNRSLENNLLKQVEYLTNMFYSQLGITLEIMNGTADEAAMTNYYNRIVEPIVSAITDEMKRKFLTKTARSQGQSILFFRDPFKLAPIGTVAEMADKFTRNEIMSSNEFRQVIGLKPSKDPKADQLLNKNLSQSAEAEAETGKAMAAGKEAADRYFEGRSNGEE